ncbi:MAG: ankyrin repeat domain-containing protein [Alphaproteobacteria bacterium]|nr:ankyrin repeat domain-containing protein [Alphaproteobacteria bacterium]OJV13582.1 MAG: hypothetical protein BGO27_03085 [Alphaproteobacteria bacterium 33-17]
MKKRIINNLVKKGIIMPINSVDEKGFVPLHYEVINNNIEAVKSLIKAGADVNIESKGGFAALHYAAYNNLYEIALILIQNAAKIDRPNYAGYRPIDLAVVTGNIELVLVLLLNGAKKSNFVGSNDEVNCLMKSKNIIETAFNKFMEINIQKAEEMVENIYTWAEKVRYANIMSTKEKLLTSENGFIVSGNQNLDNYIDFQVKYALADSIFKQRISMQNK